MNGYGRSMTHHLLPHGRGPRLAIVLLALAAVTLLCIVVTPAAGVVAAVAAVAIILVPWIDDD